MIPVDRNEASTAAQTAPQAKMDFHLVTGNVANTSISIVFINCLPREFPRWRQKLKNLTTVFPHLSVHVVPNVCSVRFVVRGPMVNRRWVADHLTRDVRGEECGIAVFDGEPARLYSMDAKNGDPSPFRIIREPDGQTALKHLVNGAQPVRPSNGAGSIFFLLFRLGFARVQIVRKLALELRNPPLRDAFYVDSQNPTKQVNNLNLPFRPYGSLFSDETQSLFNQVTMIGLLTMDGSDHPSAYLKVAEEWRKAFDEHTSAADVEIIPSYSSEEALEYVEDPHVWWQGRLKEKVSGARVPIGWFRSSASRPAGGPRFEIEQMTGVVVGKSGSGKSVVAYHLLAEYLRAGFNVVFINCKQAGTGTGPANTSELVDFATVLWQAVENPVIAQPLAAFARPARDDGPHAYYTEMPEPNDAAAEQLQALRKKWGRKFVLCFDELLNRARDGQVTQRMKDLLQAIVDEGRVPGYSYMIVHQNMEELFEPMGSFTWAGAVGKWPGIPEQATFFFRWLNGDDKTIYEELCNAKGELFETAVADITFDQLRKAPHGQMLVVQPYRDSTEKPIAVEIPPYELLDRKTRDSFAGKLSWGPIAYPDLKAQR